MPLDAFCLTALSGELAGQVTGLKIDKIQQPEQDTVLLSLRGYGAARRLLISAGTGDARVHLTETALENPQSPPMFCMLLRKHLTGAKIRAVTQPACERALDFTLEGSDALGDMSEKHLIAELMGRYSNIILTDENGRIIDCLKRVDVLMSEKRQVLPGLFYRLPPPTDRLDPLKADEAAFERLFRAASPDRTGDKWLLETFAGFSPLVAREIVSASYGQTDERIAEMADRDGGASLASSFFSLTGNIAAGRFTPMLVLDQEGRPFDFSYLPIRQYGSAAKTETAAGFSTMLDAFFTRRGTAERMRQKASLLTKTVKNAHDRVRRKLEVQREELKKTEGRERWREEGDLLTANLHLIKKGMTVIRVPDYYAPDACETLIRLDPLKTPQQNAAKYYKDYTKAKNAGIFLTEQIALGERELIYLKSVLEELGRAESERDLAEIRLELLETGYIRAQKTGKKEKRLASAPLRFVSSTGFSITAGQNNIQNETLTHKTAFKTDVWLHAQKIPGSHVVVSTNGVEPDGTTLGEAAALAAWYSQARGSKKVPVDYTLVKHVKKMPGGKPGMVTYTEYKTIVAGPDAALAERLRKK